MRSRVTPSNVGLVTSLLLCVGCVSQPVVKAIPEPIADQLAGQTTEPIELRSPNDVSDWWDALANEQLDGLIRKGLEESPSPKIALARLAQAQQQLRAARAPLWPSLFAAGSRDVRNFSDSQTDTRANSGSLGLFWDFGAWGQRKLEIAGAQYFQQERWFAHQDARLALSTSIAQIYYRLMEQQAQSTLLAAQVQLSQDLELLIEQRFRRGQARASELYQQKEQTSVLQQLQIAAGTERQVLDFALDALVGQLPDRHDLDLQHAMPETLPSIQSDAPTDLIRYRADIRIAYARLQRVAAEAGLRFAQRLPSLTVSADFTSLGERASNTRWLGHALNLAVPIFTGGQLASIEQQALEALEEERQRYHQLWLNALEEIAGTKHRYAQQEDVIAALVSRRAFAQSALDSARNRYLRGDQNYLDVLTALRGVQEAERLLVTQQSRWVGLWIQTKQALGQPSCSGNEDCLSNWNL